MAQLVGPQGGPGAGADGARASRAAGGRAARAAGAACCDSSQRPRGCHLAARAVGGSCSSSSRAIVRSCAWHAPGGRPPGSRTPKQHIACGAPPCRCGVAGGGGGGGEPTLQRRAASPRHTQRPTQSARRSTRRPVWARAQQCAARLCCGACGRGKLRRRACCSAGRWRLGNGICNCSGAVRPARWRGQRRVRCEACSGCRAAPAGSSCDIVHPRAAPAPATHRQQQRRLHARCRAPVAYGTVRRPCCATGACPCSLPRGQGPCGARPPGGNSCRRRRRATAGPAAGSYELSRPAGACSLSGRRWWGPRDCRSRGRGSCGGSHSAAWCNGQTAATDNARRRCGRPGRYLVRR